ncbi:hypothetical protein QJS04_geneDACA004257 [Acorus gramineus]|uniref:Uncharacterized protein n=1 Tax=Acorus gramineus TaxID=55184 RepID=A0AAV9B2M5_ACOGR|nr:hypothetical protein QJS04_geneDACA004257 [Acorus gramineus]
MASMKLSYQRLKKQPSYIEEDKVLQGEGELDALVRRYKRWLRLRWAAPRRPRVRVPSLAKALRRKARAACSRLRLSFGRVVKRLRESRSHMGELFAGNYLFMQVNPSSFNSYYDRNKILYVNGAHV